MIEVAPVPINGVRKMREILFKARRVKGGQWVTGHYSKSFMGSHVISDKADGVLITDQIDPKTLCQFTGACTASGIKIFEGDKVAFYYNGKTFNEYIIWSFENCSWGFECLPHVYLCLTLEKLVIKGNIHDD